MRIGDHQSGIGMVEVLHLNNAEIHLPPFVPGVLEFEVAVTSSDASQPGEFALRLTDTAGNSHVCRHTVASHATDQLKGFLKLDNIEGESADPAHPDWIEVLGVATGIESPVAAGKPRFLGLNIVKTTDKSTPVLAQSCATGRHFPRLELRVAAATAGGARQFLIVLQDVHVLSINNSWHATLPQPIETVTVTAEKMSWTVRDFSSSGMLQSGIATAWSFDTAVNFVPGPQVLQMSAELTREEMTIQWPGEAGQVYSLLAGDQVNGPFQVVQTIRVATSGPMKVSLPAASGARFFVIQKTQAN